MSLGEALVESEEPTLNAELEILRAGVAELESRLASERFTDRAKSEITTIELDNARAELTTKTKRAERLVARSRGRGHLRGHQTRRICQVASFGKVSRSGTFCRQARASSVPRFDRTISISFAIACAAQRSSLRSAWTRPCRRASFGRCRPAAKICQVRPWAGPAAALFRSIPATSKARKLSSAFFRWISSCRSMSR